MDLLTVQMTFIYKGEWCSNRDLLNFTVTLTCRYFRLFLILRKSFYRGVDRNQLGWNLVMTVVGAQ